MSCHVVSCHIMSCHVIPFNVGLYGLYYVILCCVIEWRVMQCKARQDMVWCVALVDVMFCILLQTGPSNVASWFITPPRVLTTNAYKPKHYCSDVYSTSAVQHMATVNPNVFVGPQDSVQLPFLVSSLCFMADITN